MPYIHFDHYGEEPPNGVSLLSMSGREAISELFHYELILEVDKDTDIQAVDIIGQDISLRTDYFDLYENRNDDKNRFIHGIVNCFKILDSDSKSGSRRYVAELVPSFWFLTKKSKFQVFENKKSSDIIKDLLNESRISDAVPAGKITREHCIQYLETDYEFVTRLMQDEGFIFYFEHSKDAHKLVVKDTNQYLDIGTVDVLENVDSWRPVFQFVSGKWNVGDYSHSTSAASLDKDKKSEIRGIDNATHVHVTTGVDVAGEGDNAVITRQAEILAGKEDASYEVIDVSSNHYKICAGASFGVEGAEYLPSGSASEFVVIEASFHLDKDGRFSNNFKCIPATLTYWSKSRRPRPVMNGPMTAKVINSGGDELGRVKVQFLYEGPDSEDVNSCWMRVSQVIGGSGYGAMFTPRIGEEVVVTFINGNPDRPLITGTLYNASNKPSGDYIGETDKPTKNGFLTTFDGEKFNELYFEDKPGEELFYVRTDNDYERLVEANDTLTITKGERTILIKEGSETETLNKGDKITLLKEGNQNITLNKGDQEITVDDGDIKVESSAKNIQMKAGKNLEIETDKDISLDAASNISLEGGSEIKLKVGGSSMVMDSSGITLKVGGNSIKIEQSGITVKGVMVTVEGSAKAELKSPMTTVSGDGMMTVKGGVVMIN